MEEVKKEKNVGNCPGLGSRALLVSVTPGTECSPKWKTAGEIQERCRRRGREMQEDARAVVR